jgi:soluble lytic murein transglycosylase
MAAPFRHIVRDAAARTGLAEELLLAVIYVESRFRADAVSRVGAQGLMQLMPGTAAAMGRRLGLDDTDAHDPVFNVMAGSHFLADLFRRFDGDAELALAAYNAGPTRVARWRKDSAELPEGVRRYVELVLAMQAVYRSGGPPPEEYDRSALEALLAAHSAADSSAPLR